MTRALRTTALAFALAVAACAPARAQAGSPPASSPLVSSPPVTGEATIAVATTAAGARLTAAPAGAPGDRLAEEGQGAFCAADPSVREAATWDVRGLRAVYCTSSRPAVGLLTAAHRSARPVFYGGVPLAWGAALIARGPEGDLTDAYRLTLTQVVTYGLTAGLKRLVGRPRPYVTRPLRSRSSHYANPDAAQAYHSFPSGHASLSAGLAASWSLSHPQWYVVAPSAVWATAVAVSRLHLGVHYPSDVLAGALLGGAVATGVHLLRRSLTPERLSAGTAPVPALGLTVRL